MTAGLRMRERVTACSLATANVSASQTYARRSADPTFRTRGSRDFNPAVRLMQMRAFFCVDLFHMARPYTGSEFRVQGSKARV